MLTANFLAKQNIYDLLKIWRSLTKEAKLIFEKLSMFIVIKRAETVKLRLAFYFRPAENTEKALKPGASKER